MVSTRPKKWRGPTATHPFSVVVEDMRSQFRVFGESLQGLREHMDTRFDEVDCRFDRVENEIVLLKDVSQKHTRELKKHTRELNELKTVSSENTRELKEVNHQLREILTSVDRVAEKVAQKVDRVEVEAIVERALSRP
jgi:septal ring factor EnvC (AmiA/AmiB activator)